MKVESLGRLLLGLGTGAVFGALLQRGRAGRYQVVMDQLLLRGPTIVKIMGTASAVGAVGLHAIARVPERQLVIKPLQLGGTLGGGLLFGTGLALLGYCPGTTLAAVGEGRHDALAGVLGMLAGAGLFVAAYPSLKPLITAGDLGETTLPQITATPAWPWVAALGLAVSLARLREA